MPVCTFDASGYCPEYVDDNGYKLIGVGLGVYVRCSMGLFNCFVGYELVWFTYMNNNFGNGTIPWKYMAVGVNNESSYTALIMNELGRYDPILDPQGAVKHMALGFDFALTVVAFAIEARRFSSPYDYINLKYHHMYFVGPATYTSSETPSGNQIQYGVGATTVKWNYVGWTSNTIRYGFTDKINAIKANTYFRKAYYESKGLY